MEIFGERRKEHLRRGEIGLFVIVAFERSLLGGEGPKRKEKLYKGGRGEHFSG